MFWKGKVSLCAHLEAFLKQRPTTPIAYTMKEPSGSAIVAKTSDAPGIANLLNGHFETNPRCSTAVTVEWVLESIVIHDAIWIIVKDVGGTIRGCICSMACKPPYPQEDNANYGIVDWFCVDPLWRSRGFGSSLLETLDYVTYERGRRCHLFLKEGFPLPQMPIYATFLQSRRAGNPMISGPMPKMDGLYPYMTRERETGHPLVRVDLSILDETRLDTILPPCIVLTSCETKGQGWKTDSLVCVYAFRWTPGKWLGTKPAIV